MSEKGFAVAVAAIGAAGLAVGLLAHQLSKEKEEEQRRKQITLPGAKRSVTFTREQEELHWRKVIEEYYEAGVFRRSTFNKELLRARGIPPASRPMLWPMICGADKRRQQHPRLYTELLRQHADETTNAIEDIEKDLHRTFPDEKFFQTEKGISSLRRVLVAFSWHHPEIGYCQAMNYVCGAMLLSGCSEDECFWLLDTIVVDLLPPDFYSNSLKGLKKDLGILRELVASELPRIHAHLTNLHLPVDLFAIRWFLCLFVNAFPLPLSTRFLDCFLYEGRKTLFRTSLALLKLHERNILNLRDMGEAFVYCRDLPSSPALHAFEDLFQPHLELEGISSSRLSKLEEKAVPVE